MAYWRVMSTRQGQIVLHLRGKGSAHDKCPAVVRKTNRKNLGRAAACPCPLQMPSSLCRVSGGKELGMFRQEAGFTRFCCTQIQNETGKRKHTQVLYATSDLLSLAFHCSDNL